MVHPGGGATESDEEIDALVAAAIDGDRSALNTLLTREYPRIHGLCRRIAGNDADGADAAQEALIAIARGLPRFDRRARFSTWSYRVATNACLDELRRRNRRPTPHDLHAELAEVPAGAGVGAGGSGGAATDPERAADRVDLDRALAELPLEFRAAVVLRDLCQLDYAEIAEALDVPAGTVRSRIARGRAALAKAFGNQHPTAERPTAST